MSGEAHMPGFAPAQRSSKETWQRRRVVGNTVSDSTELGIELNTKTDSSVINHYAFTFLKALRHPWTNTSCCLSCFYD